MSNKELIRKVDELIKEVDKTHRYSMSRIYGLYNQVFYKNEKPQSCASCLIRKVKELREWSIQNSSKFDEVIDVVDHKVIHEVFDKVKKKGRKKKEAQ